MAPARGSVADPKRDTGRRFRSDTQCERPARRPSPAWFGRNTGAREPLGGSGAGPANLRCMAGAGTLPAVSRALLAGRCSIHAPVNPLWVVGILAAAVGVVLGLLYLVRNVEPADGLFIDVGHGNALYGLVSNAFAVLLAFVVFVAYQSFNQGRSGAELEAVAVGELFRTAEFFAGPERQTLQAEIACYARAAVDEWPLMRDGDRSRVADMWVVRMQRSWARLSLDSPTAQAAFSNLAEADDDRTTGRRERLAQGLAVIATPVWFTLAIGGAVVILAGLLFADPRERFLVQASLLAAVTIMVVAGLMLVWFLDHPFEDSTGSIRPVEMQRSIEVMDSRQAMLPRLCTSSGTPRPA